MGGVVVGGIMTSHDDITQLFPSASGGEQELRLAADSFEGSQF